MSTENDTKKNPKPMGFGKTMLASAVGMLLAMAALYVISLTLVTGMLISAIMDGVEDKEPLIGDNFVVELSVDGMVTESPASDLQTLFSDETGTSIEQLLRAIDAAIDDDRVNALYLHVGGGSLSWAQAEELRNAIADFHELCEKPVIAYGEIMTQPEYYLASVADMVAVHPSGVIDFRGIGGEVMFYKGLLDKLGIHMELIRPKSNAYKSAGESYTRTNMSDDNREQVRTYICDIWNYTVESIATSRGIEVEKLNSIADNLDGYLPQDAFRNGLVDTLCFAEDIKTLLKEKCEATKIIRTNRYAKDITDKPNNSRIAVIYAEGNVVSGTSNGTRTAVYGDDIAKALTDAAKDKKVKAIVLRVNSPGGAVTASETMTRAVIAAKEKKPVVVSMSGVAASAGYEISSNASCIVAHPTTLTGSIGVFATIPELGGMLRQKLGITTDTVSTNKNSTGLSTMRPLSPTAKAMLQRNVEEFYVTFCQRVADGRGLTPEYVDSIARGRVWTGIQAQRLGLVDTLGGLTLALHIAAEKAEVEYDDCTVVAYPAEKSLWEQLLEYKKGKDEVELRSRMSKFIPYYSELEDWATMEPLQARLPFILKLN